MAEIKLSQIKKSLLTMLTSTSLILTGLVMYFGIYMMYDPELDLLSNIVYMSYGVGDLILVILALLTILVVKEYGGGKLASFWKTIAAGLFLTLLGDILYAIYISQILDDIKPYTYIDLLWIGANLVLAYGLLENALNISAIRKNIKLKLQQR